MSVMEPSSREQTFHFFIQSFQQIDRNQAATQLEEMVSQEKMAFHLPSFDNDSVYKGRKIRLLSPESLHEMRQILKNENDKEKAKQELVSMFCDLVSSLNVIFEAKKLDGTREAFAANQIAEDLKSGKKRLTGKNGDKEYDEIKALSETDEKAIKDVIAETLEAENSVGQKEKKEATAVEKNTKEEIEPAAKKPQEKPTEKTEEKAAIDVAAMAQPLPKVSLNQQRTSKKDAQEQELEEQERSIEKKKEEIKRDERVREIRNEETEAQTERLEIATTETKSDDIAVVNELHSKEIPPELKDTPQPNASADTSLSQPVEAPQALKSPMELASATPAAEPKSDQTKIDVSANPEASKTEAS